MFDFKNEDEGPKEEKKPKSKGSIAKKDFVICHNEYYREIKKGDDISDVPSKFKSNLKIEGIL